MRSINKVFLLGNVGGDVELRVIQSGTSIGKFSVATHSSRKRDDGEWDDFTEWHRIVVFGDLADRCGRDLIKGSAVLVEGRAQTRTWDDPERGKQYFHEVRAYDVLLLPGPRRDRDAPVAPPPQAQPEQHADGDIPF